MNRSDSTETSVNTRDHERPCHRAGGDAVAGDKSDRTCAGRLPMKHSRARHDGARWRFRIGSRKHVEGAYP